MPVFAAFSTFIARLNVISSSIIYLILIITANYTINDGAVNSLHQWSVTFVGFILLTYLRFRSIYEVKLFILQQETANRSKQLIEAQRCLTDQMAAFLPKEIYKRVNIAILRGENPVSAVDNQLRAKRVIGAVLFTDIRGFTKLTKKGVDTLLNVVVPAQKRCTDIVEQNSGVPRLQGDLVYSYYDQPNSIQN